MHPPIPTLYRFTLARVEGLMADVPQAEMLLQPHGTGNPPAWLLGHLAIATDYALQLLGKPGRLPKEWHTRFGPKSPAVTDDCQTPTKDELMRALREGYAAVLDSLPDADPAAMAAPNPLPFPFLQETLPTAGDLLGHLLTTHAAEHVGHLSNWRRQTGRAPLF
jgi:hypothetical protein